MLAQHHLLMEQGVGLGLVRRGTRDSFHPAQRRRAFFRDGRSKRQRRLGQCIGGMNLGNHAQIVKPLGGKRIAGQEHVQRRLQRQEARKDGGAASTRINAEVGVRVGDPLLPDSDFDAHNYFAEFRYDSIDDVNFPHHGHTLEIGWTIVPAIILIVVAVPALATLFKLTDNVPKEKRDVTVVVVGMS